MSEFRARGADPVLGVTITLAIQGSIGVSSGTVFGSSVRTTAGVTGTASASVGSQSGSWVISPAPTFTVGVSSPYTLSTPPGYTAGGRFGVDSAGPQLPTGMTLTEGGSLDVGSAQVQTQNGVLFEYLEPGALPTLTVHSGPSPVTQVPYMATVYPIEGNVPAGRTLSSPDDPNLAATVLSAWPDGSAQVMVLAGQVTMAANTTKALKLKVAVPSGASALTVADITSKFTTGISVNFGAGVQTLNTWTNPDRVWWANSQVICARYRLACGLGVMEAVIDVHAFAGGRAFVEVVIENGTTNASAATVTAPATQIYTNATVSVNGVQIQGGAGVSSPTTNMAPPRARISTGRYGGGHSAFRSWYCSGWVGVDPGVEVTHDADSLQAHPWFYKRAAAPTYNLQTKYAQTYDTYEPWALCRLRYPGVNGGGDDEQIGLLTMEQADYILTGDKFARRSVLATGIAPLSLDLAWRHTDGTVPTRAQVLGKNTQSGTWPRTPWVSSNNEFIWGGDGSYVDGSHLPNIALVPFLCRPSPRFIEMAQCEFLFNHSNYNSVDGSHEYDQARSRGWRARNMATTIFLTPDADATRKAGYRTALVNQINVSRNFMDQSWNLYKHISALSLTSTDGIDGNSTRPRVQAGNYMHWLIALSWHSIANGKVLRGADQTMMEAAANQVMEFPLRWFNDTADFRWRGIAYQATVGIQSGVQVIPQYTSVIDEHFYDVTGTPPSGPGPWLNFGTDTYDWSGASQQLVAGSGLFYPEHAWFVLCCAVERGAPGAEAAWAKVVTNGGITNLGTWLAGHGGARSYLNRYPRGK